MILLQYYLNMMRLNITYFIRCFSYHKIKKNIDKSLVHGNIKKIYIDNYKENEFPYNIKKLSNLEELIVDLDYEILDLECTETKESDGQFLQLLPQFKKLKSLSINLKGVSKASDKLFKAIFSLKNLETLIIKSPIASIPKGISNLKKISNIDINCSELFNISDDFLSSKLKTLHLRSVEPRVQREFNKMFEYNFERNKKDKTCISYSKIDYYYGRR